MLSRARLAGVPLLLALALTGCSGDDETPEGDGSDSPDATSSSPYLEVPDGVDLTTPGVELSFGETATVAYEPRQGEVAALDLTVRSIEKASFKMFVGWKLKPETLATTPYFVQVKVTNVGETDLGGREIPLYAVDGDNRLIRASTFASTFKPCPSELLPKKFGNGDTLKTCLVYLAPDKGEITAGEFRPTEEFNPILWTGEVGTVETKQDGAGKGDDAKGDGKKKNGKKNG